VMRTCEQAHDHLSPAGDEDQNVYRDAVHSCFTLGFEVS